VPEGQGPTPPGESDARAYAEANASRKFDLSGYTFCIIPAVPKSEIRRGHRIKIARGRRGLTQTQLAEKVGVTRNTINRVENDLARPSLGLLDKIAAVLRVKITELV
jgi:DNA-binding XRE family transcriptional regulator